MHSRDACICLLHINSICLLHAGCATREDFEDKYGDDLFLEDVEEYDRVAKV